MTYTKDCKDAIDKARDYFDELPEEDQALVENKQDLFDAEAAYKALDDQAKANAAKELIEAIGTVEYTDVSKEKIDAAKEAYEALTDDQKALIASEDATTMTTAETVYVVLGNQQKANEVKGLIDAIGEVTYPDSKEKIDAARGAYDALNDVQKELVDNYETLINAEAAYAQKEAAANKKLSGGAIAGIVIGCVAFAGCAAFLLWFFLFKKKTEKKEPKIDVAEVTDEPKEEEKEESKED